ncbi:MAG: methyltransferase domain-containing protein [Bacteroidetes bacterium]|nr:methyltransferase domain-containing protein [Bacteroidota bacterium]
MESNQAIDKYLNVGCGHKYHSSWTNLDMVPDSDEVTYANLVKGIPFPENYFDVVYHSQVLEHIPRDKAASFLKECCRVLKPGAIIRVVVPDLENIVDEYKKCLLENLNNPSVLSEANYEWIMLEMLDQMVRNKSGGDFVTYLKRPEVPNESYVIGRAGYVADSVRKKFLKPKSEQIRDNIKKVLSSRAMMKRGLLYVWNKIIPQSRAKKVGKFRLGGEVHMWMYDRYSLSKLLRECGFGDISIKTAFQSEIPNWERYELDVKDNKILDPTSLFMEAKKIIV